MQTLTRVAFAGALLAFAGLTSPVAGAQAGEDPAPAQPTVQPAPEPAATKPSGLALEGEEAEAFLRSAEVVKREDIGKGITRPQRLTLRDGTRTARAVWKTIDVHTLGQQRMAQGWEFDFRDSWKGEVAAYELDKLLGLHLVPPTVERRIDRRAGSLQLWVEQAQTEDERQQKRREPPHLPRWNNQLHNVRLLHQLAYNADFLNVRNVLSDPSFRVYAVDNSRAFRIQRTLLAADDLVCFSRSVLERLKTIDRAVLHEHLAPWLDDTQIEGLLARRDLILAIVEKRVQDKGEGAVLFY